MKSDKLCFIGTVFVLLLLLLLVLLLFPSLLILMTMFKRCSVIEEKRPFKSSRCCFSNCRAGT